MNKLSEELLVKPITGRETHKWLKEKHYAKRVPSITYAYGLIKGHELVGVVTYGKPPSPSLCDGVCGKDHSAKVFELNRLVLLDNRKNEASFLVANSLQQLPKPKIIISYADTSYGHGGIINQAGNFLYTGLSDKRTEWREKNSNAHSKTICEQYTLEERMNSDAFEVVERPRKHRYIFIVASKTEKRRLTKLINYDQQDYPRGVSRRYDSSADIPIQGILL